MVKRIRSINEFHQVRGLVEPNHPLISVVEYHDLTYLKGLDDSGWMLNFYSISLKRTSYSKITYGQQENDFDNGLISFIAPNQVFRILTEESSGIEHSGWLLLIHQDFLWNTHLAQKIKQYEYFNYAVNEALFLCHKAEIIITSMIKMIQQEYNNNIDGFSQSIIVSHIEALLNYSARFYHRQFITRSKTHHQIINEMDKILTNYFEETNMGLPTVKYLSSKLGISPSYLRDVLKNLTGKNTQQHIHDHLIGIAKEKLITTNLSVSEIAYKLGFEHAQSFSKLFKLKTQQSPLEFKAGFN